MTCLLFCEHLDTLLAEGNFSFDLYVSEILKNLTSSSFSVEVVVKSFYNFSQMYFFQISHCVFCKY